jgi:hypothetical protein
MSNSKDCLDDDGDQIGTIWQDIVSGTGWYWTCHICTKNSGAPDEDTAWSEMNYHLDHQHGKPEGSIDRIGKN